MVKGKSYEVQKTMPWLQPGVVVVVQPGFIAEEPYLCIIKESVMNWVHGGQRLELCTDIPWKHGAVIWPYWAHRISKASPEQTKEFLLKIELLSRCENIALQQ